MLEIGGYLPLELEKGREYFRAIPEQWIRRVNCGRTALYAALHSLEAKRVWVPYYYCSSAWEMLQELDIEVVPYHITEELLPEIISVNEEDILLIVNYYGILDKKIRNFIKGIKKVIIDNAQAFFCLPVMREGVYNIYSCRKFVGVADGAYLIGIKKNRLDLEQDISYKNALFLLKSIETGTNGAYRENLENEERLGNGFYQMSKLTQKILDSVDYEKIKEKRKNNFTYVHQRLSRKQHLEIEDMDCVAYCYPLLLEIDLRKELIEKNIYVPTLWKELIDDRFLDTLEYSLAKNMLCIPIDQRYGISEMEYVCNIITNLLGG